MAKQTEQIVRGKNKKITKKPVTQDKKKNHEHVNTEANWSTFFIHIHLATMNE